MMKSHLISSKETKSVQGWGIREPFSNPTTTKTNAFFQGSNLAANNQGGARRLSTTLGSTLSLNDDVSIVKI